MVPQARSWFILLILTSGLGGCRMTWHEATHQYGQYQMDASLESDSALSAYLLPFRERLDQTMNDTIARVARKLTLDKPESTLGNLLADLVLDAANRLSDQPVDLAVLNYGGVRRSELAAGPLRVGMVFELMPFDNQIAIVELDAGGLTELLQRIAGQNGWPISRTVRMQIRDGQPEAVLVNRVPIVTGRTYRVAMPDYIAHGGDRMTFLRDFPLQYTNVLIRDAILQYCRDQQALGMPVDAVLDGRIISSQE